MLYKQFGLQLWCSERSRCSSFFGCFFSTKYSDRVMYIYPNYMCSSYNSWIRACTITEEVYAYAACYMPEWVYSMPTQQYHEVCSYIRTHFMLHTPWISRWYERNNPNFPLYACDSERRSDHFVALHYLLPSHKISNLIQTPVGPQKKSFSLGLKIACNICSWEDRCPHFRSDLRERFHCTTCCLA
jgi:hypothetical protein